MTPEKFSEIIADYCQSRDGIERAAKRHGYSERPIWNYIADNNEAQQVYARARITKYEKLIDEIHELENRMHDAVANCDPKRANAVQSAYKCEIDNLKWILAKIQPRKYGDRVDVTSGGDKLPAVSFVVSSQETVTNLDKAIEGMR